MDDETKVPTQGIRLANWSAVLGAIALLTTAWGIGVLLALVAIACAVLALHQLPMERALASQGLAVAGLLAGVLALLLFPLLLATTVPHFLSQKQVAAHERCYANLLMIDVAKEQWARQHRAHANSRATGAELFGTDPAPERPPACPSGGRYVIGSIGKPARCSIREHNQSPGRKSPPGQLKISSRGRGAKSNSDAHLILGVGSQTASLPPCHAS